MLLLPGGGPQGDSARIGVRLPGWGAISHLPGWLVFLWWQALALLKHLPAAAALYEVTFGLFRSYLRCVALAQSRPRMCES